MRSLYRLGIQILSTLVIGTVAAVVLIMLIPFVAIALAPIYDAIGVGPSVIVFALMLLAFKWSSRRHAR